MTEQTDVEYLMLESRSHERSGSIERAKRLESIAVRYSELMKACIDVLPYLPDDIIVKHKPQHVVAAIAFRAALKDAMRERI